MNRAECANRHWPREIPPLGGSLIRGAHESLLEAFVELDLSDVSLEALEAGDDDELPSPPLDFDSDEELVFSDELLALSDEVDDSPLSAFLRDSEG